MKRALAGTAVFIAGIVCYLIFTYGPVHAQGAGSEDDIMAKLNEISKGQEEVMAAINSMKQDMQIIKIRITQSQ